MKTIHIEASGSYDVVISPGLLGQAGERIAALAGRVRAMVVSDEQVFSLYGEKLLESLHGAGVGTARFVFPQGEQEKNLATYGALLEALCRERFTRKDWIVALGGGVVGDLAGFAAATYQRGIPFVQLPTTLLAAVDASVGGKTAVDLAGGKNQAGAFYQPRLVLCDTDCLATLTQEEYRCGCAEIIKYAMIGSPELFAEIARTPVSARYEEVIARCVAMKRDYVQADEFDTGVRMLLNFGHSFGHAAEACSCYSLPHGEAVAMGMAVMCRSAAAAGFCPEETAEALVKLLRAYGLPTELPYGAEVLAEAARADKKAAGDTTRLVVPEALHPDKMACDKLWRLVFDGQSSFEPVISNLVLACGKPVNIMYASTRDIGGTAYGQMVLQLPEDPESLERILAYAREKGLFLEEFRHV